MNTLSPSVEDLKRRRPEWTPWLALVEETLRECGNDAWQSVVPARVPSPPPAPAISGSAFVVPESLLRRLAERLAAGAMRLGTAKMSTVRHVFEDGVQLASLFRASLEQDARLLEVRSDRGIDPEALQAVVTLLAWPLLHACRTRWMSSRDGAWLEGHCPICGAWPAFAEVRGVERSRYHRCGRCGSEWHAHILQCVFCRTTKHEDLVTLVPDKEQARGSIEACHRCGGYLKVFTRLQGCPAASVVLADLASVDLDLAALGAGYRRPAGAGYPVAVLVDVATTDHLPA